MQQQQKKKQDYQRDVVLNRIYLLYKHKNQKQTKPNKKKQILKKSQNSGNDNNVKPNRKLKNR